MRNKSTLLSLSLLTGLLLAATAHITQAQQTAPSSELTKSPDEQCRIWLGDVLDIHVGDKPQLSRDAVRVDDLGKIRMPLIVSEIRAACRTTAALADEITALYLKVFKLRYQVKVSIQERKLPPVAVIGAVNTPSRFELQRRARLLELLALAGGMSEQAGTTIHINHLARALSCDQSAPNREDEMVEFYRLADVLRGDETANPYVQSGDIIVVPVSNVVYVVGKVEKPQAITFKEPITVTQAITMAGGVLPNSETKRVRIVRQKTEGTRKTEFIVDLKAIKKHRAEDLVLQPYDIVDVPGRWRDHPVPVCGPIPLPEDALPLRIIK